LIAHQTISQRANDRNTAADAGFEAETDSLKFSGMEEAEAVQRKQSLVGGDHVLARGERAVNKVSGRLDAAEQFDHQVATVVQNFAGIGSEKGAVNSGPGLDGIAHQNFGDTQFHSGALANERAIFGNELQQPAADSSTA